MAAAAAACVAAHPAGPCAARCRRAPSQSAAAAAQGSSTAFSRRTSSCIWALLAAAAARHNAAHTHARKQTRVLHSTAGRFASRLLTVKPQSVYCLYTAFLYRVPMPSRVYNTCSPSDVLKALPLQRLTPPGA